jgi:hypothetical protein
MISFPSSLLQNISTGYQALVKNEINRCCRLSEGINNKIKRLKRMAYGYRDVSYFLLKNPSPLRTPQIDIPHSLENTFRIFHSALQEYDVPQDWPDELILRLSPVFNRLHELIVEKPLVGEVMMDKSLAEYIGQMLTGSGLKKRNRDRGSVRGSMK